MTESSGSLKLSVTSGVSIFIKAYCPSKKCSTATLLGVLYTLDFGLVLISMFGVKMSLFLFLK